ncbi:MAG: trypsin-like peptidase domain-containing protein [Nitrososphaeraceae archaeon]|nr:trypsin-like peptidase domain-containing protein [Nitrososphaeraceae archaeon]
MVQFITAGTNNNGSRNIIGLIQSQQQQQLLLQLEQQQIYHNTVNAQQISFQDIPIKSVALPAQSTTSSPSSSPLPNIFKQVENSVVQITSKTPSPNSSMQIINGDNPLDNQQSTRLGSGFVYDKLGHIISNSHVIDGARTVDVTFIDGNTYTANVIGNDASSDIAVLQVRYNNTNLSSPESLVPLVIANSSGLEVGQQIIAIGNPFGLSDTMTTGIVSQIGRLLPNPDTGFSIPNGIQTDAAINPGNSGGPLLNLRGEVVGMNTAIISGTGAFSGLGFAVPSNAITRIVPTLIQKGSYDHPWIGIAGGSITPEIAQSAGLPPNYKGVVIGSVQPGSPADKAGLKGTSQDIMGASTHIGDIITAIDGHTVKRIDDIINYIELHKSVDDRIKLTINRNGQTRDLDVILQARPSSVVAQ